MENSRGAPAPLILHTVSRCMLFATPRIHLLPKAPQPTYLTGRLTTKIAIGASHDRTRLPSRWLPSYSSSRD